MHIYSIGVSMHDDVRKAACDWLRANGVDPARTTADPIQVDGDTLSVKQFVFDGFGHRVLHRCCDSDEARESHYAKRSVTVPLLYPAPPELDQYVVVEAS